MIIELTENNFREHILTGLKLVEFYTPWCGYCTKQNAILEEMKDITTYKLNGDDYPYILEKYGVHSFPTFVIFKDGKVTDKFSGLHSKFDIMNILTKYMRE